MMKLTHLRIAFSLTYIKILKIAKESITIEKGLWPKITTLIVGDSIIIGVLEEGLRGKGQNVKVRSFPGATVDDLNHYVIPLLQKKPSRIIVHAGTMAHNSNPYHGLTSTNY